MRAFHVITGLPRSGSTLLCNLLNQNPDFYASSTSVLAQTVGSLSTLWSNSTEITADRVHDAEATDRRLVRCTRALIQAWYEDSSGVVFDKGRGWTHHGLLLKQLCPEAKIIVTVRELRSILGSVEKQHRQNPILDIAQNPTMRGIYQRADQMFSPQGIIGGPLLGIMDLIRRQPEGLIVVQYEALAESPTMVMARIYDALGEPAFEHDFDNVVDASTDSDPLYLGKFPHLGAGKVELTDPNEWRTYVSQDVATEIMNKFHLYNSMFGYV